MRRYLGRRSRSVLLPVVLLGVQPACAPAHPCPAGYDMFGPITVPPGGNVSEVLNNERDFVWRHWHARRPGCTEVTTTSPWETVRCTDRFTIGPAQDGRWRIVDHLECGRGAGGWPKPTSSESTWYSVQRVPKPLNAREQASPLPDSADVPADSYLLIFSQQTGKPTSQM